MTTATNPSHSSKRTVYLSDQVWEMAAAAGKELNMSTSKVLSALVLQAAHLLTPPTIKGLGGLHIGVNSPQSTAQNNRTKQLHKKNLIKQ